MNYTSGRKLVRDDSLVRIDLIWNYNVVKNLQWRFHQVDQLLYEELS